MFHVLDIANEEESLLLAIAETIEAHLETLNPGLVPLRLEFDWFFNETDFRKKLEPLFEAKFECEESASATFAEVETTLVAHGEGSDLLFADFDIAILLTGGDGAFVEVHTPRGHVAKDGNWAEVEAQRLMQELVKQNSFEAREKAIQSTEMNHAE